MAAMTTPLSLRETEELVGLLSKHREQLLALVNEEQSASDADTKQGARDHIDRSFERFQEYYDLNQSIRDWKEVGELEFDFVTPHTTFDKAPKPFGYRHIPDQPSDPTNDPVHHPSHYTRGRIEVIDYIRAWDMSFLQGNVIKYVSRYEDKGGVEDLKKAKQYLDWLIDEETKRGLDEFLEHSEPVGVKKSMRKAAREAG